MIDFSNRQIQQAAAYGTILSKFGHIGLTALHITDTFDFRIANAQISDGPFSAVSMSLITMAGSFSVSETLRFTFLCTSPSQIATFRQNVFVIQ